MMRRMARDAGQMRANWKFHRTRYAPTLLYSVRVRLSESRVKHVRVHRVSFRFAYALHTVRAHVVHWYCYK